MTLFVYTAPELPGQLASRWDATTCPGNPRLHLVVVRTWASPLAQSAYEAMDGVIGHHGDDLVHPRLAEGCGAWGVTPTDTHAVAMRRIARFWAPISP